MRERPEPSRRATAPAPRITVEAVVITRHDEALGVLGARVVHGRGRESWEVPWTTLKTSEALEAAARRVVRACTGMEPAWMEQVGAFADGRRHPAGAALSVAFVAVVPSETRAGKQEPTRDAGGALARAARDRAGVSASWEWVDTEALPPFGARHRAMVDAALAALRLRMDYAPIPFRLLPPQFTLSDLQRLYELLLGRGLHKASFRRALHAAWLVEPTDEWRSEGRGRPAQLFRFAPRKRRAHRRGARFDLL